MTPFTEFLSEQGERWTKHDPAKPESIVEYEQEAGVVLLPDYKSFLLWSNGGTLRGSMERFELDRIEYMSNYLVDETLRDSLPEMIVFGGTDGGGIYFFDPHNRLRRGPWAIYWGQMGDAAPGQARFAGKDLLEVAKRIMAGVDFFTEPRIGP